MCFGMNLSSVVTKSPEEITSAIATTFAVVILSPNIKEIQITESTGEIYTSGAIFEASSLDKAYIHNIYDRPFISTPLTSIITADSMSGIIKLLHVTIEMNEKILAQKKYINTLKDTSTLCSIFENTENSAKDVAPIKTVNSTNTPEKSIENIFSLVKTITAAEKPNMIDTILYI